MSAEYTGPKHRIAIDRHKAVLASFMRLQGISYLLISYTFSPNQREVSLQKVGSYSWQMIETLLECN